MGHGIFKHFVCWRYNDTEYYKQLRLRGNSRSAGEENISSGTAFFINNRGIANNHVDDGCKELKINYADKEYDTKLIAKDKNLDLALLKLKLDKIIHKVF